MYWRRACMHRSSGDMAAGPTQGGFPSPRMWKDRNARSRRGGCCLGRWRFSFLLSPRRERLVKRSISRKITHDDTQARKFAVPLTYLDSARSLSGNFICSPFTCRLLGWTMKKRLEYRNHIASLSVNDARLNNSSLSGASVVQVERLNYDSSSNWIAVVTLLFT